MASIPKSFVDHQQRAGRLWPVLVGLAGRRETTIYSEAARQIGIHWRPMGHALGPIQNYCLDEGLPRLTALVHGKTSGLPGGGFLGVPGDEADIEEVYSFDWSSISNPFSTEAQNKLDEIAEDILQNPMTAPDRWVSILSRGDVQRAFRLAILKAYGYRCAVCSIGYEEVLEAAHIVPWASGRRELRADPRNGLCLCANHHKLFDAGVLQIGPDYIVEYGNPDEEGGGYEPSDQAATVAVHGSRIRLPENMDLYPLPGLLQSRQVE